MCEQLKEQLPFYHLDKVAKRGLETEVISQAEADLLIQAELGRKWVISVDDFISAEIANQK